MQELLTAVNQRKRSWISKSDTPENGLEPSAIWVKAFKFESIKESLNGTILQDGTLMMSTDSNISTAVVDLINSFLTLSFYFF
mgnify:CR=1 FL=1